MLTRFATFAKMQSFRRFAVMNFGAMASLNHRLGESARTGRFLRSTRTGVCLIWVGHTIASHQSALLRQFMIIVAGIADERNGP